MKTRLFSILTITFISLSILALCFTFASTWVETVKAAEIKPAESGFILSSPKTVCAGNEKLYVLLENGLIASIDADGAVKKEEYDSNLAGGQIAVRSSSLLKSTDCSDFAALNGFSCYVRDGKAYDYSTGEVIPSLEGKNIACLCGEGSFLYYICFEAGRYSLERYALGSEIEVLDDELTYDGNITDVVFYKDSIYYSTDYSLFRYGAQSLSIGGIISMTSDSTSIYYVTRSGKICKLKENGSTETLLSKTDSPVCDFRADTFAIAAGNIIKNSSTSLAATGQINSISIDYFGNIFYSTKTGIFKLGQDETLVSGNVSKVVVDRSHPDADDIYYLSSGSLYAPSGSLIETGVTDFDVSINGNLFILKNGEISSPLGVIDAQDAIGFFTDNAQNVFSYSGKQIKKNGTQVVFSGNEISSVSLSKSENEKYGLGDLIVTDRSACDLIIVSASDAKTDMLTDKTIYQNWETEAKADIGALIANPDIRTINRYSTYVYPTPCETKGLESNLFCEGDYCIVLKEYEGSDYYYVYAESAGGRSSGYINKRMLSDPLELSSESFGSVYARSSLSVYALPTTLSEKLTEKLSFSEEAETLRMARDYKDSSGRKWVHIKTVKLEGYVPLDAVSQSPISGDDDGLGMFNDSIVCKDGETIAVYESNDSSTVLARLENGTKVFREEVSNGSARILFIDANGLLTEGWTEASNLSSQSTSSSFNYLAFALLVFGILSATLVILIVLRTKRRS